MLDPTYVRDHFDETVARLRNRGPDAAAALSEFPALEAERRRLIPIVEGLKRDQKAAGQAVACGKKEGRDVAEILAANKARSAEIRELEANLAEVDARRDAL